MTEKWHPINLQHPWLREIVLDSLHSDAVYTVETVRKRVIRRGMPLATPLASIFKRMKILPCKSVSVVISDAAHRMFAIFPHDPAITNFENKYCQSFAYRTQACLIRIVQADLIFVSPLRAYEKFGVRARLPIVVMRVLDFEIFQRDQVTFDVNVQKNLKDLYSDPQYIEVCFPRRDRYLEYSDSDDNADVVSV